MAERKFSLDDILDILRKGYLVLKPLHPIDWRKIDEAHRAEAAVLRAM